MKNEVFNIAEQNAKCIKTVCDAVFDLIYQKPEKEQFEYFYAFMDEVNLLDLKILDGEAFFDKDYDPVVYAEASGLKDRLISNLIHTGKTKKEFYSALWDKMNDVDLVATEDMRRLFFRCLWSDKRIPYFYMENVCSMDNDEYSARTKEIKSILDEALFITSVRWEQRTQKVSQLMRLAEQIDDLRTRTVFWAVAIGFIEMNCKNKTDEKDKRQG